MTEKPTRVFEAFNARFLSAEQVARTFIPPPQYAKLTEQSHSVLFGPRGSGKTTLLKMLQLRTLASWNHASADEVRDNISFHSIFLGTDVLWGSQLEIRTSSITDPEKAAQIRRTSFRLHLAIAILNAIDEARDPNIRDHPQLSRFYIALERDKESDLVRALAAVWYLTPPSFTILGLRTAVFVQLSELLSLVNNLRIDNNRTLPSFVGLDPIPSAVNGLELINATIGQPERKWAILCDELEIAPEMIREELFSLLRSSSHNILFKFSFFPFSSEFEMTVLDGPNAPTAGNDYAPLDLTYGRREGAYAFCAELLAGMIKEAGGKEITTEEEVLGDGWFDGGRSHRRAKGSPYAPPEGEFYRRAKRLFANDPSFKRWLTRMGYDLMTVHLLENATQAPFRKALPFILTRSEFVRKGGNHRSRKSLSLYTGTYSMFSLTEGNPRTFINLMRPIVAAYAETGGTVGRAIQAGSAEMTIHRFRSSLSAIPAAKVGSIRSILHLVEIIGTYFENAQLNEEFRAEPSTTFTIDDELAPDLVELVGRALNAGALVRLDEDKDAGVGHLRGARLRLAYTLAPEYKLPLVSGRSISLSSIMSARDAAKRRNPESQHQARLPFTLE